jgi:tryptophan-rich sensory protein
MNWLIAGLLCVAAFVAEHAVAGRDPNAALKQVRQPAWTLTPAMAIGLTVLYYSACFFVVARLIAAGFDDTIAAIAFSLMLVVLGSNSLFNWLFFHRRDLRGGFLLSIPYAVLVAALIAALSRFDAVSAWAMLLYALSLPYAVLWSYSMWRMNS